MSPKNQYFTQKYNLKEFLVWQRAMTEPCLFLPPLDQNAFIEGVVTLSRPLQFLRLLALLPDLLTDMIPLYDTSKGIYQVRYYKEGRAESTLLDDHLPYSLLS